MTHPNTLYSYPEIVCVCSSNTVSLGFCSKTRLLDCIYSHSGLALQQKLRKHIWVAEKEEIPPR